MISVDGQPAIPVAFARGADLAGFINNMRTAINTALLSQGMTGTVAVGVTPAADGIRQLRVTSNGGSVAIGSAQQSNVAAALQLGVANGGIEITRWSRARPAPTGIVARLNNAADDLGRLHVFAIADQNAIGDWQLTDTGAGIAAPYQATPFAAPPAQPMYVGASFVPPGGDSAPTAPSCNLRQRLGRSPLRSRTIPNRPARRTTASRQACRVYGLWLYRVSRDRMPAQFASRSAGATNLGAESAVRSRRTWRLQRSRATCKGYKTMLT